MIALYINCKLMRDSQHVISIAADLVMPAFALSSDVVAFRGSACLLLHGRLPMSAMPMFLPFWLGWLVSNQMSRLECVHFLHAPWQLW
jgi:hypothetical protein